MSTIIKQIDTNLEKYYKVHGVNNYRDDKGQGKFQLWTDENGMDSDAIIEELETADANDSILTDIDDDFPLENNTNREQQIFDIIKKCLKNENAAFYKVKPFPDLNNEFFDIEEKTVINTKQLYSNQCASIMNSGMLNDTGLFNVITIGRKNGFPSYMQHLTDTFSRDRLSYYYQYKDSKQFASALDAMTWAHEKNSPIFRNIDDEKQRTQHMAAIQSYYARLVPKLMFTNYTKIQDSIEQTARYITSAALFVHELSKTQKMFPFHIDITIGYKKARIEEKQIKPDNDDDDDELDEKKAADTEFFDCIGNVKDKLDSNNLAYVEREIDESKDQEQYTLGASGRAFKYVFEDLKHKLQIKDFPHGRRLCGFVDRRGNDPHKDTILMYEPPDNCKYIPHDNVSLWYLAASRSSVIPNKGYDGDLVDATNAVALQVCKIIMDRHRQNGVEVKESDYACTLAKGNGKMMIDNGMEFDLIVKVKRRYYKIIVQRMNVPSMKYILKNNSVEIVDFNKNDERVEIEQMEIKSKEKLLMQNIKSNDHCKGGMLTISFHAIQQDEIKCYLYFNGQVTRFFPETDIKDLLPVFFDEEYDKDNETWAQGDDVKRYMTQLNGTIRDHEFEAFYEKYKSSFIEKKRKDNFLDDKYGTTKYVGTKYVSIASGKSSSSNNNNTTIASIDDTTELENEIIHNEKQYQISLNDTSKLENEIIRNEKGWRKYVKSLPSGQRRGNNG
eukprot:410778_1